MTDETTTPETETDEAVTPEDLIAHFQAEADQWKEKALRAAADAENTKRRAEREANDARAYAIQKFARDLLGVADNLSRALQAAPKDSQDQGMKNLVLGVEMTEQELVQAFERNGLKRVHPARGDRFDPNLHAGDRNHRDQHCREPAELAVERELAFVDQQVLGDEDSEPADHQPAVQMDDRRCGLEVRISARRELGEAEQDEHCQRDRVADKKFLVGHIAAARGARWRADPFDVRCHDCPQSSLCRLS